MTDSDKNITPHWEHFSHEADMGIRGFGADCAEAFEQAALALSAVVTDLGCIKPAQMVNIMCEAPDVELLLVDWLNAIIYEMATRHMLFSHFKVQLTGSQLNGSAWGEPGGAQAPEPAPIGAAAA